jgi:sortase B
MNQPDFSDYHTIIYGHNMKNGTMFGSLKKYRNEDNFWENNQYFTIYTEDTVYRYQIFSYYNVSDTSNIYTVGFGPGEEFQQFIDGMVASSYENTGISPQSDNHIVTLSTCTSAGDDKRFVIHAVCIEESPYNGQ